ncbi:MAG: hypothetical protein QGH33_13540 [Pirellulaceae bacterium]|jgi:hypothetical protein|nr:hypothetical protein [Pirellulaceae bacterium]MDP7303911.1 hypothetical protein [Pirellulaceae bacterium]HJN07472.1 hypothetical protein [Pirellulaceae bacterium]
MRKAFLALAAFAILAASGCHHNLAQNGCSDCGGGYAGGGGNARPDRVARLPHGAVHQMNNPANGGPPSATTAYPYYSVRAPRDFLSPNPPSIGY